MERIQLLNRFYRPSGSTIYKGRIGEVTIPKLTGMALEDAALELNRLGLDIASRTGLSAGFVDQCVDKVLWSWRSYKALHND